MNHRYLKNLYNKEIQTISIVCREHSNQIINSGIFNKTDIEKVIRDIGLDIVSETTWIEYVIDNFFSDFNNICTEEIKKYVMLNDVCIHGVLRLNGYSVIFNKM